MNRHDLRELKRDYDNPEKFLFWLQKHDRQIKYACERDYYRDYEKWIDYLLTIVAYTIRYKMELDRKTLPQIMAYIIDNIDAVGKDYVSLADMISELHDYGIEYNRYYPKEVLDLKTQEQNYLDYINEHLSNIQTAWDNMKIQLGDFLSTDLISRVDRLVSIHDLSKFTNAEFDGYRQWYYPADGEEKSADLYNSAWKHHYTNNPHHWQYWKDKDGVPLDERIPYIIEMVVDWTAMGYKYNDKPWEYYEKEKGNIVLSDDAREYLEKLLNILKSNDID